MSTYMVYIDGRYGFNVCAYDVYEADVLASHRVQANHTYELIKLGRI